MKTYLAVLTLLVVLSSSVWSIGIDEWGLRTQPDGTTFEAHVFGDEFAGHQLTADSYEFVYGIDSWYYYAELDAQGEYRASSYKWALCSRTGGEVVENVHYFDKKATPATPAASRMATRRIQRRDSRGAARPVCPAGWCGITRWS